MESRKSFFNAALFRKNITGCWPLWAIVGFFCCFVPLSSFFSVRTLDTQDALRALKVGIAASPGFLFAMVGIVSVIIWRYLCVGKRVNMLHSMPVTRTALFVTNTLSAFVICLIPYAAAGLVFIFMFLPSGVPMSAVLMTVLVVLCEWIFFYSIAAFCTMAAGSSVFAIVLYGIFNVLAAVTEWLVEIYSKGLLYGVNDSWLDLGIFMPLERLSEEVTLNYGEISASGTITELELDSGYQVLIYAAAGLAVLAVSYLLYRFRRSETAGDTVAVKAFKPIFKYGFAIYCALLLGIVLYSLTFGASTDGDLFSTTGIFICTAIGGFIGFFAAEMLLKKKFRVFTGRQFIGAGAIVLLCAAFCFGIKADPMGLVSRVPAVSEIEKLVALCDNMSYELKAGEDEMLTKFTELHQTIVDNKEYYASGSSFEYGGEYRYIYLKYLLKDGSSAQRTYNIFIRNNPSDKAAEKYDKIQSDVALNLRSCHLDRDDYMPVSVYIYSNIAGSEEPYLYGSEKEELLKALKEDIKSGRRPTYKGIVDGSGYSAQIELEFLPQNEEKDNTASRYCGFDIDETWINTTAVLKKLGRL